MLAHDWLCGLRGGERVLDRIASVAGEIGEVRDVLAMFDDGRPLTPAIDGLRHHVASLGRMPGAQRLRRWMLPLYPAAVSQLGEILARLHKDRPIDLVISTSSAAIKGLRTPAGVPHLCYCHSPARYLWSRQEDYGGGMAGRLRLAGLAAFGPPLRAWDRRSADNVTRFVANSTHVAEQIQEFYDRDATVVHPPVRTEVFTPDPLRGRGGHWLAVGALEPYKRFDRAIEAARAAGRELRIIGGGSQRERLERLAPEGVRFLGHVDEAQLVDEMRAAGVLLFPQIEDFGIVAVEAQACGLPVAATARGGATDIVIDGVTGALCDGTPDELARAAERAEACDPRLCWANAQDYRQSHFDEAMREEIRKTLRAS